MQRGPEQTCMLASPGVPEEHSGLGLPVLPQTPRAGVWVSLRARSNPHHKVEGGSPDLPAFRAKEVRRRGPRDACHAMKAGAARPRAGTTGAAQERHSARHPASLLLRRVGRLLSIDDPANEARLGDCCLTLRSGSLAAAELETAQFAQNRTPSMRLPHSWTEGAVRPPPLGDAAPRPVQRVTRSRRSVAH